MTSPPSALGIPPTIDGDDDDVAWALQTAQVQWKRGAFADAVVWLERAVESAMGLGAHERAADLNRAVHVLKFALSAPTPPAPPESGDLLDAVDEADVEPDSVSAPAVPAPTP